MRNAILLSGMAALLLNHTASAATLQFDGTFNALYGGGPISSLTGSYSFQFDNSIVNPVGTHLYDNLPLTSFSMTPNTIGSTAFTTANTGAALHYTNGNLMFVVVGGLASSANSINGGGAEDDFNTAYNATTNLYSNTVYHLGNINGATGTGGPVSSGSSATLAITIVPEPTILTAAILLPLARRSRRN